MAGIDGWLLADRDAPRKQRHTGRRVWQRLVAEHGAVLAEITVSRYVTRRRRELGLDEVEVAIPQTHLPGAEAEVDFGEFHTLLGGVDVTVWMFVMRLSHSGRAFHMAFGNQAQESFLEGQIDPRGAELLVQIITEREERASIAIATSHDRQPHLPVDSSWSTNPPTGQRPTASVGQRPVANPLRRDSPRRIGR